MPTARKPKKKKVTPAKTLRKKAIELACTLAKERDEYTCQHCGKSKDQGWIIHASHVVSRSLDGRLAADPVNIKALCFSCHEWWAKSPCESGPWFKDKFPARWAYIYAAKYSNRTKGTITRLEWQYIYDSLKERQKHKG